MFIPFTDRHCYERHEAARELNLKRERIGPMLYHVESERRTHSYTVMLTEDGYQCNCWAVAHCKHGPWAAAAAFPSLLRLWRIEAECRAVEAECEAALGAAQGLREARRRAECAAWRESVKRSVEAEWRETELVRALFRERQERWEANRARLKPLLREAIAA